MNTTISSVVLETPDVAPAEAFYAALGLTDRVQVRETTAASEGFRGYTLSLVVDAPPMVEAHLRAAVDAGATVVKPAKKSLWGFGASFRAPDGAVWTLASSSKKPLPDDGNVPASLAHESLVLLLAVDDVKASKQFYVERGFEVDKSFGGKYAEFAAPGNGVTLALNPRQAGAKNAGVDAAGTGSHRIVVRSDAGAFTDPDGFVWE